MKIARHLQNLPAYHPMGSFEAIAEKLGRSPEDIIKLNANENPYGPAPAAKQALIEGIFSNFYPDAESRKLREALSQYTGVPVEYLFVGSGADELIELSLRLVLNPGDKVANLTPTFSMYAFDTFLNQGELINIERNPDFSIPLETVIQTVEEQQPRVLFLTTPNNPDGSMPSRETIQRILDLPVLVILDEAYLEFLVQDGKRGQECSFIQAVPERENLIVLRTFSKWAGLAGLRVGYGAFPKWMHAAFWTCKHPFNVNVAAQKAALASLENLPYLENIIEKINAEKENLYQALQDIPFLEAVPNSQGNFILCKVLDRSPQQLANDLMRQGVLIRDYSSGVLQDTIRITVGRPQDNEILMDLLKQMIDPVASSNLPLRPLLKDSTVRTAQVERATKETQITLTLNLDGTGLHNISTGLPFFDHMLTQLAVHGLFDLTVLAKGDLEIDPHHTVEDVGLALGGAFLTALGDRKGILRMATMQVPMDESLAQVTVDFSGRPYAVIHADWTSELIGGIPATLFTHFLESFASEARCNLHISLPYGRDSHHQAEAVFKALARALAQAVIIDPRRSGQTPSSKGVLF